MYYYKELLNFSSICCRCTSMVMYGTYQCQSLHVNHSRNTDCTTIYYLTALLCFVLVECVSCTVLPDSNSSSASLVRACLGVDSSEFVGFSRVGFERLCKFSIKEKLEVVKHYVFDCVLHSL